MYNRKDSYYLLAKKEGYKSRAAYKLKELNQKYKLIRKGSFVLDCGAAPGGWSQVALEIIGSSGKVVAVDYAPITDISSPNFIFIEGDLTSEIIKNNLLDISDTGYDVVMSDMAPKTCGVKLKDHLDCMELADIALELALKTLRPGGSFIVKLFDGEERENYIKKLKTKFKNIKTIRPDSTRKNSYEMYIIGTGFMK